MSKLTAPVTERDHKRGPDTAPVTMVEYGDFQCPACGRAYWILDELVRHHPDLKFVFRHFPLTEIHPLAMPAAMAAEAADHQGRFWEMFDVIYQNQADLSVDSFVEFAEWLGLDLEQFLSDLEDEQLVKRIREDVRTGARSGVNGTPTIFINGARYQGAFDLDSLEFAISQAGGAAAA